MEDTPVYRAAIELYKRWPDRFRQPLTSEEPRLDRLDPMTVATAVTAHVATDIPQAILDNPALLATEAYVVSHRRITWRERLSELTGGPFSVVYPEMIDPNRLLIVQFFACLETRRIETGSA